MREPARGLHLGAHLVGLGKVGLREHEDLGSPRVVDVRAHPLVARAHGLGDVNKHRNHVDVRELGERGTVELLAEGVLGLVETRRVDDDDLAAGRVHHGPHALARGLRHGRGDGEALAAAGVEQRGLTGVGPADEGDESTAEGGLGHGLLSLLCLDVTVERRGGA